MNYGKRKYLFNLKRGTFYFDIMRAAYRNRSLERYELEKIIKKSYEFEWNLVKPRYPYSRDLFQSHLSWDLYHLRQLGLIKCEKRGTYNITSEGKNLLQGVYGSNSIRRRYQNKVNTAIQNLA